MENKPKETKKNSAHAVGRRKNAICTVNIMAGEGESFVNGKKFEEYFTLVDHKALILKPFVATDTKDKFHFTARVSGGGVAGQADAMRLALARSLSKKDNAYHTLLSTAGLLTRDPRAKERKKIFFVRARKRPQYSKR